MATAVPGTIESYLDRARAETEADLEGFLQRVRADDAYGDYIAEYPSRGGKGLRPALGMAALEAHGGTHGPVSLAAFSALELLHNAFLVHDDLEDGSTTRRGEPCLHVQFGEAAAVHAGDSLMVLSFRRLDAGASDLGWSKLAVLRSLFESTLTATVEGQGLEFGAYRKWLGELDERTYVQIVARKTAHYTCQFPVMTGALLASWSAEVQPDWQALADYGLAIGLIFQVVDDLKNYHNTADGKAPYDDLREGKLTPLLISGWRLADEQQRAELGRFFALPPEARTTEHCSQIKGVLDNLGAPLLATRLVNGLAEAATGIANHAIQSAPGSSEGADFLRLLPKWLTDQVGHPTGNRV